MCSNFWNISDVFLFADLIYVLHNFDIPTGSITLDWHGNRSKPILPKHADNSLPSIFFVLDESVESKDKEAFLFQVKSVKISFSDNYALFPLARGPGLFSSKLHMVHPSKVSRKVDEAPSASYWCQHLHVLEHRRRENKDVGDFQTWSKYAFASWPSWWVVYEKWTDLFWRQPLGAQERSKRKDFLSRHKDGKYLA